MQTADSLRKDPDAGKGWRQMRRGWQRMKWLGGIADAMDLSFSSPQEVVKGRKAWRAAVHEVAKSQTRLGNWTTTMGESTVMIGVVVAAAFTYLGPALLIRLAINSSAQWPWRPRVSRDSIGALPGLVGYKPWFFLLPWPYFPKPSCTAFPEILWITQYPFEESLWCL